MTRLAWGMGALCALALGCGSSAKTTTDPGGGGGGGDGGGGGGGGGDGGGVKVEPPIVSGDFTFYAAAQGLPAEVWDVSADEGGNVYVAAGDALFAKRRGDADFKKFVPAAAGLTKNCDEAKTTVCPIVSVAGGPAGVAYVGLRGIGSDYDYDPDWQMSSGGLDVVAFDGTNVSRTRHVEVAGAPHQMCGEEGDTKPPCRYVNDVIYEKGRRKVRQVLRMAVNHDGGKIQYGDVWIAGTHGTFSLLVASPEKRGWVDLTKDFPGTEDRKYVWEHNHPAPSAPATINGVKREVFLTGSSTAIAIDPIAGDPWGSNEVRTAAKRGYAANSRGWEASMWPGQIGPTSAERYLDIWPDPISAPDYDAMDPRWLDAVTSLSFCDDGTLWAASSLHGLARISIDRTNWTALPDATPWSARLSISQVDLPAGLGNNASAVACDPSDGSIWVGFGWGGFGRYDGGRWTIVPEVSGALFGNRAPVRNIQIDRWATPRIVYVAHAASRAGPGGVTVYDGP